MEAFYPMLALALGVVAHIFKKGAKARMTDETFSIKAYLVGHPYQTVLMVIMSMGSYFQLISDPSAPITLFAAFMAGVASNSLADMAPGGR